MALPSNRLSFIKRCPKHTTMLYHLKVSLRHLFRNKRSSLINIGGLALGISAFLLILEYVSFEKGVNKFHKNISQIYRVINESPDGNTWPETEPGWAAKAIDNFPEITATCRYAEGVSQGIVKRDNDSAEPFRETNTGYADGNFFSFFSFPLIAGQPSGLAKPNTVFISSKSAKKYFGAQEPMGQTLTLFNQFGTTNYTVAGIYSIPTSSDIQFDMVFSYETLKNPANLNENGWAQLDNTSSQYVNTYLSVKKGVEPIALEKKLTEMRTRLKADKDGIIFHLQSLANIHLPVSLQDKYPTIGNLKYVYILSLVAIMILAIAWFNYINLSTANALKRSNEVGVRKVVGASRSNLVMQFLTESILVTLLGAVLALVLVQLVQPFFNKMVTRDLSLASLGYGYTWMMGIGLLLAGSLLAGIYTAYSLSGFNPIQTMKGKLTKTSNGAVLRKSLVVTQFAISVILILVTLLIYQQLSYMQSRNLGLQPEQVIVLRGAEIGKDSSFNQRKSSFLNTLASQSFVKDYAQTGTVPGNFYNFTTSGFTQPNSVKGDELKSYSFAIIDNRYLEAYKIGLRGGRNFTQQECTVSWNDNDKVMMNETAVRQLGFKSPDDILNTRIQWDERQIQVVGVVKDYHHTGLQRPIDPIIFYPSNNGAYYSVRLGTADIRGSVAKLESLYKSSFPGNPFEYFFEDENFNKQYLTEQQYGKIFTTAAIWAILIACLGLFGLTTFSMEARRKEIGIRKVLGASVISIVGLVSKEFLKLIAIAVLIAAPLAWWAADRWLQDFAYRIQIEWWVFAIVGVVITLVALLTIGMQTIKAALANPVKSLHVE